MAGDDVIIIIRADNGQAVRAIRDTEGRLRDMRGRFVSEGSIMSGAMNRLAGSIGGVKGSIIPLAAAAAPLAAAFAPIAVKAGGASLAVAAFGVAVAGQVSSLKEAGEAQKKYEDAVTKSGRGSKQAAEAQRAATAALAGMPEATQRAAVGMQTLKGQFRDFSDSTAKFTMVPVEKSFTVLGQIIPKLTPMVKGTSEQLDRLVTVAGGAVASPGFDALSEKVSKFANSALKDAVDGIMRFSAALASGDTSGPIKTFMDYAQKNGPAARETLSSLGDAVSTLVAAAAAAGPGMLTLVNAAARLVASLPPELVTVLMQTAVALKAVSLAGAAAGAIAGGVATLGTRIAALGAASAAAGGGIVGMNAALNTLGAGGKAMLAAGAVGALALVMHQLSDNKAPVAVDELTTSLNTLATTGQVTGALKGNFDEMSASIAMMSKGASDNKFLQLTSDMGTWLGIATGPSISDARKNVEAWDKVMANNVAAGNPKLAAQQYDILRKAWLAGGGDLDELKESTTGYADAQAAAKLELELSAQSMGIFGLAAQDTSAKLEAQQGAADGLRASILALNDVNRSAHDAQTQFEGALDALTASFAEHGATLNADTEAGRLNRDAMSAASAAQGELLATGIAAGDSLASMTGKSETLRAEMMRLAVDAFGGNKQAATEYVNTLLGVPSEIKTLITAEKDEALTGLRQVQTEIEKTPGQKSVRVDALNGAAIAALEAVGLKTRQLPDGRTEVYAANGKALGNINAVTRAMNSVNGKVATTYVSTIITTTKKSVHEVVGATGGLFTGKAFRYADGGVVSGPGTGTSDDVFAPWLSNGEFVMKKTAVDRYGEKFMQSVNDGQFKGPGFAKGGKVSQAQLAERSARADLAGQFGINRFGRAAGWSQNPFEKSLGAPQDMGSLVSALSKMRGDIGAATHGRTESSLLRTLDSVGKRLIGQEKALGRVNGALEKARDKLDSLKSAAASLSSSVKSGILTSANITRGGNSGGTMTVASIMGGLTESRDKGSAFAQALKDLKAAGLDKGLIAEIAQAGTEGGGLETAGALLGASGSEIESLNKLRADIVKSAGSAGATAADAMYGAGIKAAEGLVKGLQSQQDAIERQMMRLAKSMESAIKKALGIKSPSKVMEEVGDYTAEGFAQGITGNRSVTPAWESMLNTPRGPSSPGRATGGAQEVKVVLEIHGSSNSRYEAFIVEELRRAVRGRGSVEATLKPSRGR
jgi:hypothetical protein